MGKSHERNRNEGFVEIVISFCFGYWFALCLEERSIEMGIKNMKEKDSEITKPLNPSRKPAREFFLPPLTILLTGVVQTLSGH